MNSRVTSTQRFKSNASLRKRSCALLVCTGFTSLPALAQDASTQAPAETSAAGGNTQLEEVMVTAQRREQRLQDIPVSVTAIDAATLQASGISNVKDLAHLDPSLNIPQVVGVYLPFLRGIGNAAGGNLGNESSVPVYIDDIYYTRLSTAYLAIDSVERVEVLKGPQGTLFGRNSSGGAIQIVTKDPGSQDELNATVGYANYDRWSGQLYAATPLTDTLSWNIAVARTDQREGWGKSLATGREIFREEFATVRSKLVWEPSDSTRVKLAGFYAETEGDIGMVQDRHSGTYASSARIVRPGYPNPAVQLPSLADVPGANFYDTRNDLPQVAREEGYGGSLRIDQSLGFADLVSITGFRRSEGLIRLDVDITEQNLLNGDLNHIDRQFTQELQLKSLADSYIDWLVGAYYLRSKVAYVPSFLYGDFLDIAVAPGARQNIYSRQIVDSYSAFGQATAPLGDRTNATLGLRYTKDDLSGFGRVTFVVPGAGETPTGPDVVDSKSFEEVTWKAAIDHHLNDDTMTYASLSRGYKSGAYRTLPLGAPPADPEIVDAYEVGLKTEFLDRRIRLEGALFWNEIKDPQVLTVVTRGLVTGIALTNAEKARIKGAELGLEAIATDGLKLRGAATYLDGEYVEYTNAPFYCLNGTTIVGPATLQQGGPCPVPADGANGNRLPNVSKWRFDVGANYELFTGVGEWVGDVSLSYTGRFAWNPDNLVFEKSVTLVNASLSFTPASLDWMSFSLWGKNLGDVEYYSVTQEAVGQAGTGGFQSGAAAPRTYGGSISVKF